jgi:hypothetical protein
MEATIDALYYSIITEIISRYELLLTSVELAITNYEQRALHIKTSKKVLDSLDILTRQIIVLRSGVIALIGKSMSITYDFENLTIDDPKAQGPDGRDLGSARWTVNGRIVMNAEAHEGKPK